MKTQNRFIGTALLAVVLVAPGPPVAADTFQLISARDPAQGAPAGGGGGSGAPIISPDGRYVLFASSANNLVLASNGLPIPLRVPPSLNVYLRDRTNGTTALVSVNLSGVAGGNSDSLPVDVSTNGRYGVFESSASDLVPNDTNNASDIFVRDLVSGTTALVSINTNGVPGNGTSRTPAMTPDGHFVAFVSAATDLVPDDTNRIADVFVRDLQAGTTVLASVGALATNSTYLDSSEAPAVSAEGRYVAFFSTATNLVSGAPPGGELYIRDLVAGTTTWASSYSRTVIPSNTVYSFNHSLSADGNYLAYEAVVPFFFNATGAVLRFSLSSGLTDVISTNAAVSHVPYAEISSLDMSSDGRFVAFVANGPSNGTTCVQLWDAANGSLTLVSGDPTNGIPTNSICYRPTVDASGRFVAFTSIATGLVSNALPDEYHLYLRDTQAGLTTLVDADTNGIGSPVSGGAVPRMTDDARFVAFECADSSLVANDGNRDEDVFVRELATGATEFASGHHPALPSVTANGLSTLTPYCASSDGRYIAFASEANNLVPNDTNGCRDVFLRDLVSGTTILISGGTNGLIGDGFATDAAVSPDGRYVAFTSSSDNLVPAGGTYSNMMDVFVRDTLLGTTTLVSVDTNDTRGGLSFSAIVGISGRYVLFRSGTPRLAPVTGFMTGENLFLRDMQAGRTYALTINGALPFVAATPDLGLIAYGDWGVTGYLRALYVWDAQTGARIYTGPAPAYGAVFTPDGKYLVAGISTDLYLITLSPRSSNLIDRTTNGHFRNLRISTDGRWLACIRQSNNGSTNQLFLYDLQARTSVRVDHQYDSAAGATGGTPDSPDISPDGRFVAYRSSATNIVAGDFNGQPDLFLYDRLTGINTLLTTPVSGTTVANNRSLFPVFTADGSQLLFASSASDLTSSDFNHASDIFAKTFLYAFVLPGGPGQGPWLSWPTVPGQSYGVQYTEELGDATWHELIAPITNTANKSWIQDASPSPSQRFYRIIQF